MFWFLSIFDWYLKLSLRLFYISGLSGGCSGLWLISKIFMSFICKLTYQFFMFFRSSRLHHVVTSQIARFNVYFLLSGGSWFGHPDNACWGIQMIDVLVHYYMSISAVAMTGPILCGLLVWIYSILRMKVGLLWCWQFWLFGYQAVGLALWPQIVKPTLQLQKRTLSPRHQLYSHNYYISCNRGIQPSYSPGNIVVYIINHFKEK